ncbi:MAG: T9SS type A sorting domain-containing protein [Ignavibacterium sp.]|nr:MAG: T9SS type A sorting domain-containing protein [Ignavibacterium sp.]
MSSSVFPQEEFVRRLNWIPVSDGSGSLTNIYAGGINNIEHQFIDIDGDNDLDIPFLDSDGTFGWYENIGDSSKAKFKYSLAEIPGLFFTDWFYFVDIDDDNDLDYFTGNGDQISLIKNIGTVTSPSFQIELDTIYSSEGDPIFSEFGSNPLFADIDNDGDFDFFSGNSGGTVIFYENIGTTDNFSLKFITDVWQGIEIIGVLKIYKRHGSSSLEFVDIDDDNDLDLFWGDFFSNSLYVIENIGNKFVAEMDTSNIIPIYPPAPNTIITSGFNMPRFVDIDGDDDYDLFVSVLFNTTVNQSLIYYKNEGTCQIANHQFVTNNYLKPLDVISNSYLSFADLDNDGDTDFLLGSLDNPLGTLNYLENTGSSTNPLFEYLDSAYFNITGDLSVIPSLGDLDGDDDIDLLVGLFDGKIDYYRNDGNVNSPDFIFQGKLSDSSGTIIDIGTLAAPFLLDVDNDDDLDLSVGEFSGKFNYFENTGSRFFFEFTETSSFFSDLDVGDNSSPFLYDYNNDSVFDLFSGNRAGNFYFFKNNGINQNPVWHQITDQFIPENFGGITAPSFIDIDNDSDMDLYIGNVKGGLYLYENTTIVNSVSKTSELPSTFNITAHPNPFNSSTNIDFSIPASGIVTLKVYNVIGEEVAEVVNEFMTAGSYTFKFTASSLPSGIYFARLTSNENHQIIKMNLLK